MDKRVYIIRDVILFDSWSWKWYDTPDKGSDTIHVFA